jgi:methylmalonyl-CoA/ethylmalonyl-CoA epimerase
MLLRIDHVGIACRSLEAAIERYTSVFGLAVVSQETNDEQGVREAMLATAGQSSYVQLLEPLGDDTPVGRFLARRGEGLHHVGYAVPDVVAALETYGGRGVRLIDERPRHGSMGASIAFLHPGDLGGVLTELVQPRAARETLCPGWGARLRAVEAALRLPLGHGLEPPPGMGARRTVKRPQTR